MLDNQLVMKRYCKNTYFFSRNVLRPPKKTHLTLISGLLFGCYNISM